MTAEPNARKDGPGAQATASITIGVDGRLYCHDLTPELAAILTGLCPNDPDLAARVQAVGDGASDKT